MNFDYENYIPSKYRALIIICDSQLLPGVRDSTFIFHNFFSLFNMRRFYDKRDAEDALEAMDGRMLDGRELRVQMARYGRPTSPQTRRGGRDRDRRDRGGGGGRR